MKQYCKSPHFWGLIYLHDFWNGPYCYQLTDSFCIDRNKYLSSGTPLAVPPRILFLSPNVQFYKVNYLILCLHYITLMLKNQYAYAKIYPAYAIFPS